MSLQKLHLCLVCLASFLAHVKRADCVFVFSGRLFPVHVDASPKVDRVPFDVTIPETNQLPGAQAGRNCKTVGVDIFIKYQLSIVGAGVYAKQNLQGGGLQDRAFPHPGILRDRQVGVECRVLVPSAPLDKGGFRSPDRHKRLSAQRLV